MTVSEKDILRTNIEHPAIAELCVWGLSILPLIRHLSELREHLLLRNAYAVEPGEPIIRRPKSSTTLWANIPDYNPWEGRMILQAS